MKSLYTFDNSCCFDIGTPSDEFLVLATGMYRTSGLCEWMLKQGCSPYKLLRSTSWSLRVGHQTHGATSIPGDDHVQ